VAVLANSTCKQEKAEQNKTFVLILINPAMRGDTQYCITLGNSQQADSHQSSLGARLSHGDVADQYSSITIIHCWRSVFPWCNQVESSLKERGIVVFKRVRWIKSFSLIAVESEHRAFFFCLLETHHTESSRIYHLECIMVVFFSNQQVLH
jgi:hypothetical protein